MTAPEVAPAWKSRIVGHGAEAPTELVANPKNWRRHPKAQRAALEDLLDRVGWVQDVVVNRRTGLLVDGHLRVEVAVARGELEIPVVYVDLDEGEEALVLASLDPLAALATTDSDALAALLGEVGTAGASALNDVLRSLAPRPAFSEPRPSLADLFGVPPFSVLDSRQGYWRERKRQWLAMGIRSELGRGGAALNTPDAIRSAGAGGVLFGSDSGRDPAYYEQKREVEARLGRELSTAEFQRDHYVNRQDGGGLSESGTSVFDPVLCELVYRWFSPPGGVVLDPFAGGSVRGIVASVLGRSYVGVDLSERQIAANEEQAAEIAPAGPPPRWVVGDSRDVRELAPGAYDLVFTCPPYADLEVYSDDPRDLSTMAYPAFLAALRDVVEASVAVLRPDRFACVVVGDVRDRAGIYRNLVSHTIQAFEDAGARLYNEGVLVTALGSLPIRARRQFDAGRKLGKTHQDVLVFVKGDPEEAAALAGFGDGGRWVEAHENVLVFVKGDPRAATEALGPVEVADLSDIDLGEVEV